MNFRFKILMPTLLAAALCSCTEQVVPSIGPRTPQKPEAVKIYQEKPTQYEELGTVTLQITPELGWDKNGDANAAWDQLKAKAAALGANGLLLDIDPGKYGMRTSAGYHGKFYLVPTTDKTVTVEAIFVLEE